MQTDDWFKCYGKMWMKEIVSGAYCHPAKFSRALIRRIYAHAVEEEWVKIGDLVVDPFGGVGLGALEAMRRGLHWFGMELEANYCALAQQNIDLWNERYSAQLPNWGTATILQGDSRRLASRLAHAGLCLSSPPYADQPITGKRCFKNRFNERPLAKEVKAADVGYSGNPANLGNLPDVDFEAAVSEGRTRLCLPSPPYANSLNSEKHGIDWTKVEKDYPGRQMHAKRIAMHNRHHNERRYGPNPNNLGSLPDAGFEIVQADTDQPTTFWSASREILEQVYQTLVLGGHAIFVCKRFVRDKQIVEFPTQWARLCEAVGFEWVHHHKAWQVDKRGAQYKLGGELEERQITWQTFFRRDHARKYPHLKILWEDVLCFVKRPRKEER